VGNRAVLNVSWRLFTLWPASSFGLSVAFPHRETLTQTAATADPMVWSSATIQSRVVHPLLDLTAVFTECSKYVGWKQNMVIKIAGVDRLSVRWGG